MAIPENKVRVSTVITKESYEKIVNYAEKMELTEGRLMANLLESAVTEEEWILQLMTCRFGNLVRRAVGLPPVAAEKLGSNSKKKRVERKLA